MVLHDNTAMAHAASAPPSVTHQENPELCNASVTG